MNCIVKEFKNDMKTINKWALSCNTKAQLKTVIRFFDYKRNKIEKHCNSFLSGQSLLEVGYAIGTVTTTIDFRLQQIKKEQLTIKNLHSK